MTIFYANKLWLSFAGLCLNAYFFGFSQPSLFRRLAHAVAASRIIMCKAFFFGAYRDLTREVVALIGPARMVVIPLVLALPHDLRSDSLDRSLCCLNRATAIGEPAAVRLTYLANCTACVTTLPATRGKLISAATPVPGNESNTYVLTYIFSSTATKQGPTPPAPAPFDHRQPSSVSSFLLLTRPIPCPSSIVSIDQISIRSVLPPTLHSLIQLHNFSPSQRTKQKNAQNA
jgi:hypothetical protein